MSSESESNSTVESSSGDDAGARDGWQRTALLLFLVVLVASFAYWLYQRITHVYSDDARISADMIDISSKVSGWIVEIPVSTGDRLQQGDIIATIDSREIELRLKELEADLEAMTAKYEAQQAEMIMVEQQTTGGAQAAESQLNASQAALAASESELDFRANEWQRAQTLRKKKIIPQQDYESAQTFFQKAQQARQAALASVATAQAKLVEARAAQSRLAVMTKDLAKQQFERESLAVQLERQRIDWQDRHMVAPQSGIVDKVFVDSWEYVQPGRRILLMHNPDKIWVSANIKETQVRHLQVGQSVDINVDAYPDETFTGTVEKIGHAATSQFALLPSTNPSGNFTKVTQRLNVKIAIEQVDNKLKPGMMVEIAIDIR